jgi:hypothetical protein
MAARFVGTTINNQPITATPYHMIDAETETEMETETEIETTPTTTIGIKNGTDRQTSKVLAIKVLVRHLQVVVHLPIGIEQLLCRLWR